MGSVLIARLEATLFEGLELFGGGWKWASCVFLVGVFFGRNLVQPDLLLKISKRRRLANSEAGSLKVRATNESEERHPMRIDKIIVL
jgi:hypothetical protein